MFAFHPIHKSVLVALCLPGLALVSGAFAPQQRVPILPDRAVSGAVPSDPQAALAVAIAGRVPSGTVLSFAGEDAPPGYLLCDGSEVLRDDYPALFDAIGTAWGFDTGFTFTLPDLRGRFLRGTDGTAGNDPDTNSRVATNPGGNIGNNVGSQQGDGRRGFSGTFAGSTASAGSHTHDIRTRQGDWDEDDGSAGFDPGWADDEVAPQGSVVNVKDTESAGSHSHSFSVGVTFTGEAESRPKNVYVTYIIKT